MIESVIMPAAPTPDIARPTRKLANVGAREVIKAPIENIIVDTNIQERGENIWLSRPDIGAKLDIAICSTVTLAGVTLINRQNGVVQPYEI